MNATDIELHVFILIFLQASARAFEHPVAVFMYGYIVNDNKYRSVPLWAADLNLIPNSTQVKLIITLAISGATCCYMQDQPNKYRS